MFWHNKKKHTSEEALCICSQDVFLRRFYVFGVMCVAGSLPHSQVCDQFCCDGCARVEQLLTKWDCLLETFCAIIHTKGIFVAMATTYSPRRHSMVDLHYWVWALGMVLSRCSPQYYASLQLNHTSFPLLYRILYLSLPLLRSQLSGAVLELLLLISTPAGPCHELYDMRPWFCPAQRQAGREFMHAPLSPCVSSPFSANSTQ